MLAAVQSCMKSFLFGREPTVKEDGIDVVLIGGGIMSATLGVMLLELEPSWRVHIYESLPNAGEEASNGWNNAGTGHAALCELNYTPESRETGEIDISKAIAINEQFQVSRQLWAYLVKKKLLPTPTTFINRTPHLSFVQGAAEVDFLRRRWELLREEPLFEGMEFTENASTIRKWAPLLMSGRDTSKKAKPIACTRVEEGTDVDYGTLTKHLVRAFIAKGGVYQSLCSAERFKQDADGQWRVTFHREDLSLNGTMEVRARFVFIGAGGATIQLLQRTGIPEIQGYGALPISAQFLCCQNPAIVAKHPSKVYGMPPADAPPTSAPHLDMRLVDGQPMTLFGPFSGLSARYLKSGSVTDAASTIRWHNCIPMAAAGLQNLNMFAHLAKEQSLTKEEKLDALRKFVPDARPEDWSLTSAGQSVQMMKWDEGDEWMVPLVGIPLRLPSSKIGRLHFGTELVSSRDGTMCGLLGAAPGASGSAQVGLDVLRSCFTSRMGGWKEKLKEMIPSFGEQLNGDPAKARQNMARTAQLLGLRGDDQEVEDDEDDEDDEDEEDEEEGDGKETPRRAQTGVRDDLPVAARLPAPANDVYLGDYEEHLEKEEPAATGKWWSRTDGGQMVEQQQQQEEEEEEEEEQEEQEEIADLFAALDESQIMDSFARADTDGSGKLDFAEFYQVLEELNDSAGYPTLNEEDAWHIFTECDRDGNGRITVLEFLKAHAPVATRPTEDASEDASSPSAADDDVAVVASPLASARGTRGGGILRDPHRSPRLEGDDVVFAI